MATILLFGSTAAAERPKTHDGFYLRAAGGLTLMTDPAGVESPGVEVEGTPSGTGGALDLLIGGAPVPGVFLGGGAFLGYVGEPRADDMEATVGNVLRLDGDIEFDGLTFAMLAPFIDYYPDAEGGLHLLGAVGFGVLGMGDGTLRNSSYIPFQDHGATGPAGLAGVGYDWWLTKRFSLGVMGRVVYAPLSGDDDDQTEWQHHLWLPALLISASLN